MCDFFSTLKFYFSANSLNKKEDFLKELSRLRFEFEDVAVTRKLEKKKKHVSQLNTALIYSKVSAVFFFRTQLSGL